MRHKTAISVLLLALFCGGAGAQEGRSPELSDKEIIKKGWNVGPLPVVGFDSDLGFQYGLCCDIFNYGDGSHYPQYDFKVNMEASRYTKGSSVLRSYGEFKRLIPEGKLFYDVTYFSAPKFEFYGMNGLASPYIAGVAYSRDGQSLTSDKYKSAFYWMSRSQFRAVVSMQKKLSGALNWTAGLAYYAIRTGSIDAGNLSGDDADKKQWYAQQTTLFDEPAAPERGPSSS